MKTTVAALSVVMLLACAGSVACAEDVPTGYFAGKIKTKDYAQTGTSGKPKSLPMQFYVDTPSAGAVTGSLYFGAYQFHLDGRYGQLNIWYAGADMSLANVKVVLSGHYDKKLQSIKGLGVVYSDAGAQEFIFAVKRSQQQPSGE